MVQVLGRHQEIKFRFERRTRWIELVERCGTFALETNSCRLTFARRPRAVTAMPQPQKLTVSARARGSHLLCQPLGSFGDLALVLILLGVVCLAVRFETAPLVQVNQGTTQFVGLH